MRNFTDKLTEKLNLACIRLGVTEQNALQARVNEALAYYARKRYIEDAHDSFTPLFY